MDSIRFANYDDIPALTYMGNEFFKSSGYGEHGFYEPEAVKTLLTNMIDNETVIIDQEGKYGMLGWIYNPLYMAPNIISAVELFWWVEPEKRGTRLGINLLNYFEKAAKQRKASIAVMIALEHGEFSKKTAAIYQRLNYKPKEHSFIKRL